MPDARIGSDMKTGCHDGIFTLKGLTPRKVEEPP